MKNLCPLLLVFGMALSGHAAMLLDDRWDDGDRTDTNLPEESAWYGSTVTGTPSLSVVTGALTGNVRIGDNVSSRLWITHFTPAGSPAELGIGDTLKVTLDFIPRNTTENPATSRGLRIGLFNFSEPGAARVTADGFSTGAGGSAPGTNVTGYMLNMNFARNFTINNPMQLMKRTDLTNINLMGATATFTALGTGGGASGAPAFLSETVYTFEFLFRRLEGAVQLTTRFSDTNGWSASHSVTDVASPTFKFDGLAIRPNAVADTADAFTFTRLKVETIPFAVKITSIRFRTPDVLELRWDSLPGKAYEVHWRAALEGPDDWQLLTTVPAQGISSSVDDGDVPYEVQRFYRVFQLP